MVFAEHINASLHEFKIDTSELVAGFNSFERIL
jgi:hypothetical protein